MKVLKLICIIILLMTFYKLFLKKQHIEPYYNKISNMTVEKCANFCKTAAGCYAFGYDKKNNICYPSKILLRDNFPQNEHLDEYLTYDIVYEDDYKPQHMRCNKLNTVKDPNDKILEITRKSNATYFCKDSANEKEKLMFHNNNEFKPITFKELKEFNKTDKYDTVGREWAETGISEKKLNEQQGERLQFFGGTVPVPNEGESLKPEINPSFLKRKGKNIDKIIREDEFTRKDLKIGSDVPEYEALGTPIENKIQGDSSMKNDIIEGMDNIDKKIKTYTREDGFNNGDYLKKYKCIDNVSLKRCLNYCSNDNLCKGLEHNPVFFKRNPINNRYRIFKNVCCPMRSIGDMKKREPEHSNGNFYKKVNKLDNDITIGIE